LCALCTLKRSTFCDFVESCAFLNFAEFIEIQSRIGVNIVHGCSEICRLGDEKNEKEKLKDNER
jgi:hypothetical protein